MKQILKPPYFFIGIFIGFSMCCLAGYIVSKNARFHHFSRFFSAISPSMQYFPTAHELLTTAKHDVNPNKILVLIGGSSIFRGTGHNSDDLWSKELQKQLGDKFQVLNYAVDGGNFTSFGGTAFRILNKIYPKIIYASTCTPGGMPFEGIDPYRYIFWDAYYKNLYHPDSIEKKLIRDIQQRDFFTANGAEQFILSFLDGFLYFRNLWNWVEYRFIFTTWNDLTAKTPLRSRKNYIDDAMDYKALRENLINDHNRIDAEIDLYDRVIASLVDMSSSHLKVNEQTFIHNRQVYDDSFPRVDRSKILCVMISENPDRIRALTKRKQQAHELIMNQTLIMLKQLGYHAIYIGQNYSGNDFFDGAHLMASGGKKVAFEVAKEIRKIAHQENYA